MKIVANVHYSDRYPHTGSIPSAEFTAHLQKQIYYRATAFGVAGVVMRNE